MTIKRNLSHGFTIIELLVVTVVIAIIATMTTIGYNGIQVKAIDTATLNDLNKMNAAQQRYVYDSGAIGKNYYSDSGFDSDLNFTAANGNIIDVVAASGIGYCVRAYNPKGSYNSIGNSYSKGSSDAACTSLSPSLQATVGTGLTTGIVSYWQLDELSGSVVKDQVNVSGNGQILTNAYLLYPFDGNSNDASINLRNGTVSGAVLSQDRFAIDNRSYVFNGTSSYISTPALTLGNKYFISAWIKRDPAAVGWNTIIGGGSPATNNLAYHSDGRIGFGNFSSTWQAIGGTVLTDTSSWHHIVAEVTSDGTNGTWSLYIDGLYKGVSTSVLCDGNFSGPRIGSYGGGGAYFKGNIDEVLIGVATSGSLPNGIDVNRLYNMTSIHDMNKPYVSGKMAGAFDLWGYSTAGSSAVSYLDLGAKFNSVVNGVASQFTMSFWTYKKPDTGSPWGRQMGWYGGNYKGSYFGITEVGNIDWTIGQGMTTGSNSNYNGSVAVNAPDNRWHHLVMTYDGVNVVVYFNGTSVSTYNIGSNVDNGTGTQKLIINRNPWDFHTASQGIYDNIGVWSRALTAAEVNQMYVNSR